MYVAQPKRKPPILTHVLHDAVFPRAIFSGRVFTLGKPFFTRLHPCHDTGRQCLPSMKGAVAQTKFLTNMKNDLGITYCLPPLLLACPCLHHDCRVHSGIQEFVKTPNKAALPKQLKNLVSQLSPRNRKKTLRL